MPQLDNYEVWISVDGEGLPEYGVQHTGADPMEITCWIPSEVGKAFQICYKDSVRASSSGLRVRVDGNRCDGCILHSRQERPHASDSLRHKGAIVSKDSYRPFVFSSCQLTDEDGLYLHLRILVKYQYISISWQLVGKLKTGKFSGPSPNPRSMSKRRKA